MPIICIFLILSTLHNVALSDDREPLGCGGVQRFIDGHLQELSDTVDVETLVPQEIGPASVVPRASHRFMQSDFNINTTWPIWGPGNATHRGRTPGGHPDADGFLPFYINYVIFSSADRENTIRLGSVIDRVHRLFFNLMKAIPLDDPRQPRIRQLGLRNPVTGRRDFIGCMQPKCGRFPVPSRYVGPCFDFDDNYVPEPDITREMQLEIALWYASNTSMVIYVQANDNNADEGCKRGKPVAYAQICGWILTTGRPTHGRIVVCDPPKDMAVEVLINTLVHESLHVITDGNLMGYQFYEQYGIQPQDWALHFFEPDSGKMAMARGKTWRTDPRRWTTKDGTDDYKDFYLTILPKVKQATAEHFNCTTAEGAEISIMGDGHWSVRAFPDEILTGTFSRIRRFSDMTLGLLDTASYYKVNYTFKGDALLSEPLLYSRPKERGCEVYEKSCYDIFRDITDRNVHFLGPYCDPTNKVITTRCSFDGRVKLKCNTKLVNKTHGCPILGAFDAEENPNDPRNSVYCRNSQDDASVFMSGGPDSICITLHNFTSQAQGRPGLDGIQAGCVHHACHEGSVDLNFYRSICTKETCDRMSSPTCGFSGSIIQQWGVGPDKCDPIKISGLYQCPRIEAVCKSQRPEGAFTHQKEKDIEEQSGVAREKAVICNAVTMAGLIWMLLSC